MKSVIPAALAAVLLATPALANKTPVKPVESCYDPKIMYHLEQIEMILQQTHKPKPKNENKKAG